MGIIALKGLNDLNKFRGVRNAPKIKKQAASWTYQKLLRAALLSTLTKFTIYKILIRQNDEREKFCGRYLHYQEQAHRKNEELLRIMEG